MRFLFSLAGNRRFPPRMRPRHRCAHAPAPFTREHRKANLKIKLPEVKLGWNYPQKRRQNPGKMADGSAQKTPCRRPRRLAAKSKCWFSTFWNVYSNLRQDNPKSQRRAGTAHIATAPSGARTIWICKHALCRSEKAQAFSCPCRFNPIWRARVVCLLRGHLLSVIEYSSGVALSSKLQIASLSSRTAVATGCVFMPSAGAGCVDAHGRSTCAPWLGREKASAKCAMEAPGDAGYIASGTQAKRRGTVSPLYIARSCWGSGGGARDGAVGMLCGSCG